MRSNLLTAAIISVAALLSGAEAAAQNDSIRVKAYAAMNTDGRQVPYEYNRRAMGDDDVLAEILYCGICHSDVHEAFNDWNYTVYPDVSGHEMEGRVVKAGKNVKHFRKGDKVAIAGFGGLGHLAVMYAKAFGANVTVFDRTEEKVMPMLQNKYWACRMFAPLQPMNSTYESTNGLIR